MIAMKVSAEPDLQCRICHEEMTEENYPIQVSCCHVPFCFDCWSNRSKFENQLCPNCRKVPAADQSDSLLMVSLCRGCQVSGSAAQKMKQGLHQSVLGTALGRAQSITTWLNMVKLVQLSGRSRPLAHLGPKARRCWLWFHLNPRQAATTNLNLHQQGKCSQWAQL